MKTFLAIFNALPTIIQSVQAVENAVPAPQAGKQKLDLILGAAATAWETTQVVEQAITKDQLLTSVTALTNLTVATLNAVGAFKKSNPASK